MLTLLGISAVGSTFTARQFVYKSHADVRLVTLRGDHQCSVFDDDDHFREQELNIVALAISNESTKVVFASCCPNVVMFYFLLQSNLLDCTSICLIMVWLKRCGNRWPKPKSWSVARCFSWCWPLGYELDFGRCAAHYWACKSNFFSGNESHLCSELATMICAEEKTRSFVYSEMDELQGFLSCSSFLDLGIRDFRAKTLASFSICSFLIIMAKNLAPIFMERSYHFRYKLFFNSGYAHDIVVYCCLVGLALHWCVLLSCWTCIFFYGAYSNSGFVRQFGKIGRFGFWQTCK